MTSGGRTTTGGTTTYYEHDETEQLVGASDVIEGEATQPVSRDGSVLLADGRQLALLLT